MSTFRQDPATGGWVIMAPSRRARPHSSGRTTPARVVSPCPLCPGHESETPPELLRLPPGAGPWAVRVVPNKYAAVSPAATLDEAIAAVHAAEPTWDAGDVRAKAEALMQLDFEAARAVLLDNGDWDGGLADLRDPAATGLDIWLVRGDPATGGYVDDDAALDFEELLGQDRVITVVGGPHSPQRTHPRETVAAFLRALGPPGS